MSISQVPIIVDFPIVGQNDVILLNGLVPIPGEIDDAQAGVTDGEILVHPEPGEVGSSLLEREQILMGEGDAIPSASDAKDSTHVIDDPVGVDR